MNQTQVAARANGPARPELAMLPAVDVIEDAGGITLKADLPGVAREQLSLEVDDDTLTIEATVTVNAPPGMDATHVEVEQPRYRRAFTLSKELDPAQVTAELAHGVLTLRIPKGTHAQPRRVQVRVD